MNCSKCNSPLGAGQFCPTCGLNHKYIKKACNTADYHYNLGLSKANVRDLSGAKEELKKALLYNKYHIDARNLLGLIYFETGEVVEALNQWVISINFDDTNNPAQRYLNVMQDPEYIEAIRQLVKKYNLALQYAKQGSEDLALIQVKKVISVMPKFINARLLLALLYMNSGKLDEAKKQVEKVLKIDCFHPQAVRYYNELTGERPTILRSKKVQTDAAPKEEKKNHVQDLNKYIDVGSGNKNLLISLIIGIVIGVVAMWVLIMPNQRFNVSSDYKALQVEYKETVAAKDATISQLEEDKAALDKENTQLKERLEVYAGTDGKDGMYDSIMKATKLYGEGKTIEAAKALLDVDEERLESDTAKSMYQTIKNNTFVAASNSLYNQGYSAYNRYRYEEAKELFKDSYKLNSKNDSALYFLARCYHRLGDEEKAIKNYKKVIEKFPGSSRANDSKKKLRELGVTVDDTTEATTEDTTEEGTTEDTTGEGTSEDTTQEEN